MDEAFAEIQPTPNTPSDSLTSDGSAAVVADGTIITPAFSDELLSGTEAAEIIASIYEAAGPRLGPILVESNIVLTLAGARGQTELYITNPIPEDRERISAINKVLEQRGIRFIAGHDTVKAAFDGRETLIVNIDNLKGYDRVTHATNIPGVEPYDASTGWKGLREWTNRTFEQMDTAVKDGRIPYPHYTIGHMFHGLIKGYPDIAIYRCMRRTQGQSAKYNFN